MARSSTVARRAAVSGDGGVGGLVGTLWGTVRECYATGRLGSVSPDAAGALVGTMQNSRITHAYAAVEPLDSSYFYYFAGAGALGASGAGVVDSCYWGFGATRLDSARLHTEDAVGLTSAQMRMRSSYAGWDFEGAWAIEEGPALPRLHVRIPQEIHSIRLPHMFLLGDADFELPLVAA